MKKKLLPCSVQVNFSAFFATLVLLIEYKYLRPAGKSARPCEVERSFAGVLPCPSTAHYRNLSQQIFQEMPIPHISLVKLLQREQYFKRDAQSLWLNLRLDSSGLSFIQKPRVQSTVNPCFNLQQLHCSIRYNGCFFKLLTILRILLFTKRDY